MRGATLYSSKTGLEFRTAPRVKVRKGRKEEEGGILLRAFSMEEKKQIKVFQNPERRCEMKAKMILSPLFYGVGTQRGNWKDSLFY